jgi:methylmalonyl-CoA mutase N-terminal domain/subunit
MSAAESPDSSRHAAAQTAVKPRPSLLGDDVALVYAPDTVDPDIGLPGQYPFTRGVYPMMYRDRLWQMRLYSGFGDAESTNARWRFLLEHGNNGVSAAFDLPTQCGLDSDELVAGPEVGRVGVAIDCVEDFERLFAGLPAKKMGISLNAHSTAPMVLALFLVAMERQQITPDQINGSMTTDALKDYIARGTWIYPPEHGIRLVGDVVEFCNTQMPSFYPLVIRGPDMRDAGATAIQEVGFAFANAVAYLEYFRRRGLDIDKIAPRLSAQFYYYGDFLQEAAKTRAARRLWAKLLTERFGATKKASTLLRVTASVGGTHFQASEPEINIVRGTLGCLGAVLGGVQGMLLAGYDEAFDIPTEDTARIALRTQQIVGFESDATATSDPLGGSYFVEAMTDRFEAAVSEIIRDIDQRGGAVAAINSGYIQREVAQSAYEQELAENDGRKPIVAVNLFPGAHDEQELRVHAPDPSVRERQREILEQLRGRRDASAVELSLDALRRGAEGSANLMPLLLDCARADATLGEMTQALKQVFGEFTEPAA